MSLITKVTATLVERMSTQSPPITVDCPDCTSRLPIPRSPMPDDGTRGLYGIEVACGDCGSDLDLYYLG
jgi:ribosomal protein S27E